MRYMNMIRYMRISFLKGDTTDWYARGSASGTASARAESETATVFF